MKILAVDDEPYVLELIPMIAAKIGFKDVTTALSGEQALATLERTDQLFECLLLDISMPGIDGIDLCARVRSIPAYRKVPIIMLTAMTERDFIDRAFQAGATDYATKPFDLVELGARLRVAEALVGAQRDAASAGKSRKAVQDRGHTFDLSEEISVDGIENLVDYTALKNYLTQLSRAGLLGSQVLAVKIDRIEMIFARASAKDFVYALSETADAIGDVFAPHGYLQAYAGNGIFVIVSNKASLEPSIGLETEIQNLLDKKSPEYDNGDPLDIEVSIGNPIRPNISRIHRITKTFDRAIARAENRAIRKQSEPRPSGIRMVG